MTKSLRKDLHIFSRAQKQRRTRVSQIVGAYLWKICRFENRLEMASDTWPFRLERNYGLRIVTRFFYQFLPAKYGTNVGEVRHRRPIPL